MGREFNGIGAVFTAFLFGFVAAFLGILAIFFFAIFGALVGALTGWLVSLTPILGDLVLQGFTMLGLKDPNLVALGAMIGFVAGFFKQNPGKCNFCD